MNEITPTEEGCLARQQKLARAMQTANLDLVVLTRGESINWLTGVFLGPLFEPTAAIDTTGMVTLVLPNRKLEMPAVADRVVGYESKWLSTMRNDQRHASSHALAEAIGTPPERVATEFSKFDSYLAHQHWAVAPGIVWSDIEPMLFQLRRKKHADELAMLNRANEANRAMYEHAREIVKPGINELEVYSQLHAIAVEQLGEPLAYFGQDFRCAARGGPPRNRICEAGELYILDLGVGYRGYFSDNARTIAVGGEPTAEQQMAWENISDVFSLVQNTVAHGVSCKALFERVQQLLDGAELGVFNHHLGHGVGLAPHEGPHLNPNWDDTFAEGDFFTAEPGLYDDTLRQGIRLEQNYVVTADGVELLTDWPLGLV